MATLADNNVFISLNGVDLSAEFTDEVSREVSVNINETTSGAGTDWTQNAIGLKSYSLSLTLRYDDTNFQGTVQPVFNTAQTQAVTLIYGPEGNGTGKPKDEISVIVESYSGYAINIGKDKVIVQLSLVGSDAPTALIETGGVFA